MPNSSILKPAFWLDPFRPLQASDVALLALAGVAALHIHTLEDLVDNVDQAQWLIVGLNNDLELLESCLDIIDKSGYPCNVVCRVEKKNMALAVGAMRMGAVNVLPTDEWGNEPWQTAMRKPSKSDKEFEPSVSSSITYHSEPPLETPKLVRLAQPIPTPIPTAPAKPNPAARSVVYVDPASRNLLALAQRVAKANVTVLIEGPTGSGKEVLAQVLHESSDYSSGPFVALNCAAMPEQMIEDMLFGHEKGAFTGALKEHKGLFEQAQNGTLFLDEISEMPIHLQAKLLRVLQERSLVRLGGEKTINLTTRVIAATNKDLRQAIAQREFREDLYFRISTFKLRVPLLKDRPGDILPLVSTLVTRHAQRGQTYQISHEAQAALFTYQWPGNVRELENVVQRAIVMCSEGVIKTEHLMFDDHTPMPTLNNFELASHLPAYTDTPAQAPVLAAESLGFAWRPADETKEVMAKDLDTGLVSAVKSNEHQLIMAAIETTNSREQAAKKLGISPRTLRYKLAKLRDFSPSLVGIQTGAQA